MTDNNRKELGLIVARSENNVIGKNGRIPWDIPGEMSQFRGLTLGNAVVMGRRTFEEIGRPLPGRKTIVVSASKRFEGENVSTVGTLKEALDKADSESVYIAGGYGLYKEALPLVNVMYITEVRIFIEGTIGDTYGDDVKYTRTVKKKKK